MKRCWSKAQACEFAGIKLRMMRILVDSGAITPRFLSTTTGLRRKRKYGPQDLVDLLIVTQLMEFGLLLPTVAGILISAREESVADQWDPERVLVDDNEVRPYLVIFGPDSETPEVKVIDHSRLRSVFKRRESRPAIVMNLRYIIRKVRSYAGIER